MERGVGARTPRKFGQKQDFPGQDFGGREAVVREFANLEDVGGYGENFAGNVEADRGCKLDL